MLRAIFHKLALGLAGLSALGIGLTILSIPQQFYAFYGIDLGPAPGLHNEMRATAAGLSVVGAVLITGLFVPAFMRAATGFAAMIFVAYAAGRFLSVFLDGVPQAGLLEAAVFELIIGAGCAVSWWLQRPVGASRREYDLTRAWAP